MGRKMTISSLFKTRGGGGLLAVPLCYNAKTTSFRVGDDVIKTVNSVFFDQNGDVLEAETPDSWFTNSSESASYSTESDQDLDAESVEMVVRGVVRSERLFFDPGVTSSIGDFRRSMEEMVRSQEELAKDWESLEALLAWYLKMNEKRSHGVIVSAFADLLVSISGGGTTSTPASESTRYSTAVSSLPSSPVYSSRGQNEIEEEERRSC